MAARTAARIGDATTVLDEEQVSAFVQEQLGRPSVRRAQRLRAGARCDPDLPLPLLLRAVHGALQVRVASGTSTQTLRPSNGWAASCSCTNRVT